MSKRLTTRMTRVSSSEQVKGGRIVTGEGVGGVEKSWRNNESKGKYKRGRKKPLVEPLRKWRNSQLRP